MASSSSEMASPSSGKRERRRANADSISAREALRGGAINAESAFIISICVAGSGAGAADSTLLAAEFEVGAAPSSRLKLARRAHDCDLRRSCAQLVWPSMISNPRGHL